MAISIIGVMIGQTVVGVVEVIQEDRDWMMNHTVRGIGAETGTEADRNPLGVVMK